MQFPIGQLALGSLDGFDEIIGEGAVERAADVGVGRGLGIATAGDQHLLNVGMDNVALPFPSSWSLSQLTAKRSAQLPTGLGSHEI